VVGDCGTRQGKACTSFAYMPCLLLIQELETGSALLGHEELVKAAGGRVLAAHREIGVVTATSPRPDFASKLGSLDARLVSVRLMHATRDVMGSLARRSQGPLAEMRHVLSKLQPDLLVLTQVVPTSGHGVRGGARTVPIAAHPTITGGEVARTAATTAAVATTATAPSTWGDSLSSLQWCGPLSLPQKFH